MAATRAQSRRYQAALRRVLASYRHDYGEDEYQRRLAQALADYDHEQDLR